MKRLLIAIISLLFLSCSNTASVPLKSKLKSKNNKIIVLPFKNYSDTYLAGYRVASILNGVLRVKGYNVVDNVVINEENEKVNVSKLIDKYRDYADYIIYGTVNEFRYKTGIDAEPAVSFTINIYDTKRDKVIYTFSESDSSWSFDSLTTVTQNLLENTF